MAGDTFKFGTVQFMGLKTRLIMLVALSFFILHDCI